MSKKLTRKSLALGTAIAFGSTLIAGLPAMAAPSLSLVPAYGSGYSTLNNNYGDTNGGGAGGEFDLSNIFVLKSNFVEAPSGKTVLYKIENASEADIYFDYDTAFADVADNVFADNADGYANDAEIYVDESIDNTATSYLALATDTVDENVTLKVTAFYDVNGSGDLDNEEGAADIASATRTVTFFAPVNAKLQVNLIQPSWGDSELVSQITFGEASINTRLIYEVADETGNDQVWADFRDRTTSTWSSWNSGSWAYWDSSDDALGLISDYSYSVDEAARVASRSVIWDVYNNEDVYSSVVSYRTIVEPVASDVDLEAVTGANVTDDPNYGGADYGVRTGTKTVSYEATVTDDDGDEVGAGVPVTVTLSDWDLQTGSIVTGGGKTLTAGGSAVSFTVLTNADGVAAFTLTSNKGAEDDAYTVEAEVDDIDGGTTSDTEDIAWEDAAVDAFVETSAIDYDYYTNRAIVKGGTYTLNYLVLDQFGQPTATSDGDDLRAVLSDNSGDFDVDQSKAIGSNGRVSFTVTDDTDAIVDSYSVYADLYSDSGTSLSDTGYGWESQIFVNEEAKAAGFIDINVWATYASTGDLTEAEIVDADVYDATDYLTDVTYEDYVAGAHYENVDFGDLGDNGDDLDLGFYVTDSNGEIQPGAPVTISAPGLLIQDYEYEVQAAENSLTVPADDEGWVEVNLYSHHAGVFPVTITSGNAKLTFNVAFAVDTADVDSDDVSLTLSKTPKWGKGTIDVKAQVTDVFGNPIEGEYVEFSKSGLGFLDETSDTTDANGLARVTLVGGTAGSTTVTADSDDSFDAMSVSKTLRWWNKTASATASATAGRVLVYGSAAVGDRVVVRVDGVKVAAFTTSTKRFSYVVKGVDSGDAEVVIRINRKKVFDDFLSVN